MTKVIIIGSSGAGKSTFARKLRDKTNLPLYYLDMIWHKPDKTNISEKEFDAILNDIVGRKNWIIDGNYQRTLEMRLRECDTVFLLDFPVEICLSGAESRIGTKREDLPWTEMEFDSGFRQWIKDFPENILPDIYRLLENYNGNLIVFHSRSETEDYLKNNFPD